MAQVHPASTRRKKVNYIPYLFIAPNMLLFLFFMIIPIFFTFGISLTNWSIIGVPKFIGFKNYLVLFRNSTFWFSLINNLYFTVATVPITIVLAFAFAVLLNKSLPGRGVFRTAIYMPFVVSTVASGILWLWIFNADFGVFNYLISLFGIKPIDFFTNGNIAMIPIIFTTIWARVGYNMVIYLASLQDVPRSYYEASLIDGANQWQQLRYITIPLLRPTHLFVFIMAIIFSFKSFDLIYIMTRGGPGNSTTTIAVYIYKMAFELGKMGRASALGVILFIIMATLTILQLRAGEEK